MEQSSPTDKLVAGQCKSDAAVLEEGCIRMALDLCVGPARLAPTRLMEVRLTGVLGRGLHSEQSPPTSESVAGKKGAAPLEERCSRRTRGGRGGRVDACPKGTSARDSGALNVFKDGVCLLFGRRLCAAHQHGHAPW